MAMVSATPEQVVLPKTRNTTSFSVVRLKLSFQSYVPITQIQSRSSVHFVISFDQVRHRSFFPPELSVLFPIWIASSRQAILFCPTYILFSPWTDLTAATAEFSLSIQVVLRLIEEGSLSDFLLTPGKSHDFLRKFQESMDMGNFRKCSMERDRHSGSRETLEVTLGTSFCSLAQASCSTRKWLPGTRRRM